VPKILFFIQDGWVFGKIHHELAKLLFPDFHCDVLCWSKSWSPLEVQHFTQKYDLILSTPAACDMLHVDYAIPRQKLVAVVHQDYDIYTALARPGTTSTDFAEFAGYAVICDLLVNISFSHGIGRIPQVMPVGVFRDMYTRPPSTGIRRLGYFGSFYRYDRPDIDIKRGYLAQRVADQTEIELVQQASVHFLAADQLYRDIDLVLFCSIIEGNPYPALEAFASGVPVLGTRVGLFPDLVNSGGGVLLPFEDELFVNSAVAAIQLLQRSPDLYARMSAAARQKSEQFDWFTLRTRWQQFFTECLQRSQRP